jgi:hypothetical protein
MLLGFGAPRKLLLLLGREHGRIIPLTDIASVQFGLPAIEVELTLAVHHPAYL